MRRRRIEREASGAAVAEAAQALGGSRWPLLAFCCALAVSGGFQACSSTNDHDENRRPLGRAVAGFSMGAMGAVFLGLHHPDRFDAIGALGGPMDFTRLLAYMERAYLGGFCSREELEALLASHPDDRGVLDDPARLPCMQPHPAVSGTVLPEHEQSFVSWKYTDNGGSFDRNEYLDLFTDLTLAFGNPLYHNPDAAHLPPGVTSEDVSGGDICEIPVVIEGFYNAEYNPEGRYPAITFCDGESPLYFCKETDRIIDECAEPDPEAACAGEGGAAQATARNRADLFRAHAGSYRPCGTHRRVVPFALALDFNRNGKRDYGEPILINARERFQDVGVDGCSDAHEDGRGGCLPEARTDGAVDPNGDNHHWLDRPGGTEGDHRWQPGEPFLDYGLDGVVGTGDYGEGDGAFTESPSRQAYHRHDARRLLQNTPSSTLKRLAFFADGGIRDVFNFDVSAAHVWSAFAALNEKDAGWFKGLEDFPGSPGRDDQFDPLSLGPEFLPERMLFLYGDPSASDAAVAQGDGDHVGTHRQLVNRLFLLFRWLSIRWSGLPDPPADRSPVSSRTFSLVYPSQALGGADREYGVVLPPGYDAAENANARYPVLFLLHGYGMKPVGSGGFVETALLWDGAMASGRIRKTIVVFPSGRCCYEDGARDRVCTEAEGAASGLQRSCRSGSFFVDGKEGQGYGTSVLELMDEVDRRFRTVR